MSKLRISRRELVRKVGLTLIGSFVYALGIDMFEIPNGLAAGGLTGLATTIAAAAARVGITLPVGAQTIVMNALLLVYIYVTSRDVKYIAQSVLGIVASGFFMDLLAPVLPVPTQGQLLISALWGGVIGGAGVGIVFLSGGNTGGTDIICQRIARRTGASLGVLTMLVDGVILLASVPVLRRASTTSGEPALSAAQAAKTLAKSLVHLRDDDDGLGIYARDNLLEAHGLIAAYHDHQDRTLVAAPHATGLQLGTAAIERIEYLAGYLGMLV